MLIHDSFVLSLVTGIGLTLFVYGIEEIIFSSPQSKYLKRAKSFPEFVTTFISFCLTILFFYGALVSPLWLKFIYAGFFIFVAMVEYGYQKVMRRFAVAGDVEIAFISPPTMWKDATSLFFDFRVFIPIIVVVAVLWAIHPLSSWVAGSTPLVILLVVIIPLNNLQHKLAYRLNWGSTPVQAITTLIDFGKIRFKKVEREKLSFKSNTQPGNNIVLIMDESVRADHLSVNGYVRATSPHLEELAKDKELFHNWGNAVPGATCSNTSNGLMSTGARIQPGSLDIIYRHPTIFQYAKAMGYRTVYIDVQTSYLWNGINKNDLAYIDEWIKSTKFGESNLTSDFLAADCLRNMAATSSS
jgi:glucan phosphoethanolaminetransferase (alkaline phosphatase superfamily)